MSASIDREKIDGLSAVKSLTAAKVRAAGHVWIQALTQNVRMTLDGTTPTASVGVRLTAGDPPIELSAENALNAKFIEETSSAVIEVVYYNAAS